jgi:hypothetical protein
VLKQKRAVILIDGVDELSRELRHKFWIWLKKFVDAAPGNRFYITSRPFPESNDDLLGSLWSPPDSFESAILDEMSDHQIKIFITNWHNSIIMQSRTKQEQLDLKRAKNRLPLRLNEPRNRAVRELCRTPLLCALVCAMHWREEGYLPNSRVDLYENCCTMLIELRDLKKEVQRPSGSLGALTLRDKEMILRRLALTMMRNKTTESELQQIEIRRNEAVEWIKLFIPSCTNDTARSCDAEELIDYLIERSGLLREPTKDRIDFSHRTFQEYLAACGAGEQNDAGDLASRALDDQWRGTILLAAGTKIGGAPFGNALVRELLNRGEKENDNKSFRHACFALAVGCLETGGPSIDTELRKNVLDHLAEIVPPYNFEEARILSAAGETVLDFLQYNHINKLLKKADIIAACTRTIALVGSEKSVKMLEDPEGYGNDSRVMVQVEICKCCSVDLTRIPVIWDWGRIGSPEGFPAAIRPYINRIPSNIPKSIEALNFRDCSAFEDLTLSALPKLRILYMPRCTGLKKLKVAKMPALFFIYLSDCTSLNSLELNDLPMLERLFLDRCESLNKLSFSELTKLTIFDHSGCTNLKGPLPSSPKIQNTQ